MMKKPILAIDFDGVIHSYVSGWLGPRTIPDPPVNGAIQFLILAFENFDVQIFSSRSQYWLARRAMKNWLRKHFIDLVKKGDPVCRAFVSKKDTDVWPSKVSYASETLIMPPNKKAPEVRGDR